MRRALLPLLVTVAIACGNSKTSPPQGLDQKDAMPMTSSTSSPPPAASAGSLPVEPASQAELLSATHLFSVEVLSARAQAWALGKDGLEHRVFQADLLLSSVAKGLFTVPAGQTFSAAIEQTREDELVGNDYHGLWSHVAPEPAAGVKYFVVSAAPGAAPMDPARLLQEPVCKRVLGPSSAADVALAEQGEAGFRSILAQGGERAGEKARTALLRFAGTRAASATGLFGRYLLDRVAPSIEGDREVQGELLALLARPDASHELRLELLGAAEEVTADASVDHDFLRAAARAFAGLLVEPRAAAAHVRIASVSLFQAVFPDEVTARLKPADVAADPAERAKIAAALRAVSHPHAAKLAQWLSHG